MLGGSRSHSWTGQGKQRAVRTSSSCSLHQLHALFVGLAEYTYGKTLYRVQTNVFRDREKQHLSQNYTWT
jgi:hypothetical protein